MSYPVLFSLYMFLVMYLMLTVIVAYVLFLDKMIMRSCFEDSLLYSKSAFLVQLSIF